MKRHEGWSPEQMEKQFLAYIAREDLFTAADFLLLAVSGGVDSMVLTELCRRTGFSLVMAHVNFQLRGEESQRDEEHVRHLAAEGHIPLRVARVDTETFAREKGISIQEAAREYRYDWFRQLLEEYRQSDARPRRRFLLLTAHHADDSIETMLMNFFKGTGIAGMHGILPRQGHVVRPLLPFRKTEIEQYASARNLAWVSDSSNESVKYSRNYMRIEIIPRLKEIYPNVEENLLHNIERLREAEILYRESVNRYGNKLLQVRGDEVHIPVLRLRQLEARRSLLLEWLKPFGFTPGQLTDLEGLLYGANGKFVSSSTHRVIRNRNWLVVAPLAGEQAQHILIEGPGRLSYPGGEIEISLLPKGGHLENTSQMASLDASLIQFPLLLRPWKAGDYFYPLGMAKKKKLSRFLIDLKLSNTEKEKVWVLEMDRKILWVLGYRIDGRFAAPPGDGPVCLVKL